MPAARMLPRVERCGARPEREEPLESQEETPCDRPRAPCAMDAEGPAWAVAPKSFERAAVAGAASCSASSSGAPRAKGCYQHSSKEKAAQDDEEDEGG